MAQPDLQFRPAPPRWPGRGAAGGCPSGEVPQTRAARGSVNGPLRRERSSEAPSTAPAGPRADTTPKSPTASESQLDFFRSGSGGYDRDAPNKHEQPLLAGVHKLGQPTAIYW
jgi:hypothetical protein